MQRSDRLTEERDGGSSGETGMWEGTGSCLIGVTARTLRTKFQCVVSTLAVTDWHPGNWSVFEVS